jgi:hypothetical protein
MADELFGIGVVQPQSGLDYPFVSPSEDIRYLIADFSLTTDDPGYYAATAPYKPPFRIKYLYGLGSEPNAIPAGFSAPPEHAVGLIVVDSEEKTVFDTTQPNVTYDTTPWSEFFDIHHWRKGSSICSLLAYKSDVKVNDEERSYDMYILPQNGTLDARAVYVLPKRLLSVRTKNRDEIAGQRLSGKLTFKNGYNTELVAEETTVTDFVANTDILLSAAAGSGLGKVPCVDLDIAPTYRPIQKINGVGTTTGDFLLSAAGCLYARRAVSGPPLTDADIEANIDVRATPENELAIGADCAPCCKCPEYVDLAVTINKYQSQYANIGNKTNNIKQIHEQNIQKWIDERSCGLLRPLRLLLVAQSCPYMDIVLMVCNPCSDCLFTKELRLELQPSVAAAAEVVRGYTAMFAEGINGRPWVISKAVTSGKTVLTMAFPVVKQGDSAYIRFRVKFSEKSEYAITGTLTGTLIDNTPILAGCASEDEAANAARADAEAVETQALYCDANGETSLT